MRKYFGQLVTYAVLSLLVCCKICLAAGENAESSLVSIKQMDGYYQAKIDLSTQKADRRSTGKEYGKEILRQVPDYPKLIDSYLQELHALLKNVFTEEELFSRVHKIWPNVPQNVKDELDGIADSVCTSKSNSFGDGKLSPDELKLLNFIADVFRASQCSAVGVTPEASATGKVITARNLDWDDGSKFQLSKLQSVTTYKLPNKRSLTLVGYLGVVIGVTGFNTNIGDNTSKNRVNRIYFALLDSETGKPYSADNKRSYASDLRVYAEQASTIDQFASLLSSTSTKYAFGFLVFLADNKNLGVYEDNLTYGKSALRTVKDNNNLYMPWKINGVLATVNCFMLKTSFNNATVDSNGKPIIRLAKEDAPGDSNFKRWESMQRILSSKGPKYTLDDLKDVETYGPGKTSDGYIFRYDTQQIVLFEPESGLLKVCFHPINRNWNKGEQPVFKQINLGD